MRLLLEVVHDLPPLQVPGRDPRPPWAGQGLRGCAVTADPLHERLLAEIDEQARCRGREDWFCALGEQPTLAAALRAVVARHKPQPDAYCAATCSGCFNGLGERPTYPCPDIEAIARELGVDG